MTPSSPMDDGFDIAEVLRSALKQGNELSTVEFKEYVDPDNEATRNWLLRAIAAMANGETDGFIFVGVHDKTHKVVGVPDDIYAKFDNAKVYQKVAAFLAPPPRIDVHRFDYEARKMVAIVVHPFDEVPTFVAQSFFDYSAGTILIRTPGGESAPAAKEGDIRALFNRVVAKHAEVVAGYIKRYTRLSSPPELQADVGREKHEHEALTRVRALASNYWEPGKRYLEVFFAPCGALALGLEAFKQLFPGSFVPTQHHGFPTTHVGGWPGPRLTPQGWTATIPEKPEPNSPLSPEYLWAMHVCWAFLDRDRFWEDDGAPRIVGGIGFMHLATRVCLLLRLLRRVGKRYQLDAAERFLVGTRLKGVKGRYFASEYATDRDRIPRSDEDDIEISRIVTLADLEDMPAEGLRVPPTVLDIMEEAGWKLGRTDLSMDAYIHAIQNAAAQVEPAVLFPPDENVAPFS